MIIVKLKKAMKRLHVETGERLTYEKLAARTGLSRPTLEAIGSRPDYNPTLATIDRLCDALHCQPGDLLEHVPDADQNR